MSYPRLAAHTASAGVRTIARRATRGPRLPGWSVTLELAVEVLRAALEVGITMDARRARKVLDIGIPGASVKKQVTIHKESLGNVPSYHVEPIQGASDSALLYFHGGGYVIGSAGGSHSELVARLTLAAGCRTFAVDYRLAPEHPFPAAVEDAAAAYEAALDSGVDPSRIALSGDSAGGGLSLALLLRLREAGRPLPSAAALISPWVDHAAGDKTLETNADTDFVSREMVVCWSRMYRAGEDPRNPLVSPQHAKLKGLPPLLIHAGGAEILLDEVGRFADSAKAAGVDITYDVYDGMPHVWHVFAPFVPEAQRAIEAIGRFVREKTDAS